MDFVSLELHEVLWNANVVSATLLKWHIKKSALIHINAGHPSQHHNGEG